MKPAFSVQQIVTIIQKNKNEANIAGQARFGIKGVKSYGMTKPQMRALARLIGKDHPLALALWNTGIHEARHIAVMTAERDKVTPPMMNRWLKDFNSWDLVDDCCSVLFCRTPFAHEKVIEWAARKREFEKRAAFSLIAFLAVHDKKAEDKKFERFFPLIIRESSDERNFVKKAVNWALRQIGKRNKNLCAKAMATARTVAKKNDSPSRWIAADALRELEKYRGEGRIRNAGG